MSEGRSAYRRTALIELPDILHYDRSKPGRPYPNRRIVTDGVFEAAWPS